MDVKLPETLDFSDSQKSLIDFLHATHARLALVGGAPRDLLLGHELPDDLDFEIRFQKLPSGAKIEKVMDQLGKKIDTRFDLKVELLKFSVLKVSCSSWTMEFSPPRQEVYSSRKSAHGHSDFEVIFNNALSSEESAKRRDFSVNAISFVILDDYSFRLEDPRGGVEDLKMGVLTINENFPNDPVRFARLVRFHAKYGFQLTENSKTFLNQMDITYLTKHYFFSEAFKSKDVYQYFTTFFKWVRQFDMKASPALLKLSFLTEIRERTYNNTHEIFYELVYQNLEDDYLKIFSNYVRLNKKFVRQIKSLMKGFRHFSPCDFENLSLSFKGNALENIKEREFLALYTSSDFLKLYGEMSNETAILFAIDFQEVMSTIEKKKLKSPFVGREEFELFLFQEKPPAKKRDALSFYFHLKERVENSGK